MGWFAWTAVVDGNVAVAADLNTPLTNAANGTVTPAFGGTGLTSGAVGAFLYFSGTTTIAATASPTIGADDARTATVVRNLTLQAMTSGTPAAGIGTGLLFNAESGDEAPSNFGALDFAASDVGAGTEDTYLQVLLRVAGAALTSCYRFAATGAFNAIFTHANTAARTYTLPDATGTVLLGSSVSKITSIRKTADETVNASATVQNDDTLLYALAANEVVAFQCWLTFTSNTTADFKMTFTVPASAVIVWSPASAYLDPSGGAVAADSIVASGTELAMSGATYTQGALFVGTVVNSTNAGNLQLQWAQNTSNASDTKVLTNSRLRVETIS